MAKKPTKPVEPPGKTTPAYINAPGKPIIRSGCGYCGLMEGRHTPTCPMLGR